MQKAAFSFGPYDRHAYMTDSRSTWSRHHATMAVALRPRPWCRENSLMYMMTGAALGAILLILLRLSLTHIQRWMKRHIEVTSKDDDRKPRN
ncbi:MAG: hypothetical protein JHC60_09605 [Sphingobium sp.]|nr:hypothetical protein [Sphingobium sp.]